MGDPKGAAYVLNSPDFQRSYSDRVALEEFVRQSAMSAFETLAHPVCSSATAYSMLKLIRTVLGVLVTRPIAALGEHH